MAEERNSPVSHPQRSSSLASPRTLPPSLMLLGQSNSIEDEEGHSRDTVTCTPVLAICQHELSLDIQPKDATTPVLPGQGHLPPPPDSPSIKLTPAVTDSLNLPMTELQREMQRERFTKRPSSQRILKRKPPQKNFGIVIGDFNGMLRDELTIKEGEEIEIISKDTIVSRNIGWWTGRNSKGKIGIFPAACVSCDVPSSTGIGATNSVYPLEIKSSEIGMKEVVGIGGFGKVFRAIYKGEDVAVKVAKSTTFDSLKAVQDVISEAEKFAHLAHVNICALVGVVLVKDVCLVMEYAPGGALSEVLHKTKTSLSIDVITNWTSQIASGMHYLHHVAVPSLIHRDLKTSNILLSNAVDLANLKKNTIKITDFGLAREIEHTTHMSGAGTYPWMAPEVIRTSDFSKKSDVWSFAVVLWELVTGERPYGGLNLFVVAYGVGHGTLSLPIPEGCPEPLAKLMNDCWKRDYAERPSFEQILEEVTSLEDSDFCDSTDDEQFRSMQTMWRGEIQKKFVELKKMEHELQKREQNLIQKISDQEQKRKELEEEKKKVDQKAEEYNRLIGLLKRQQEAQKDEPDAAKHTAQLVRPPRTMLFSFRKYIQRILGSDSSSKSKVNNPLPNRMEGIRRFTSSPGNSKSPATSMTDRHGFAASLYKGKGHKRRSSDEVAYRGHDDRDLLCIDGGRDSPLRRGSVPTSPSSSRYSTHQPIIHGHTQQQKSTNTQGFVANSLKRELDKRSTRQRSWSDLRSPSPQQQLLPSYLSPSKFSNAPSCPTAPTPPSKAVTKPKYLNFLPKGMLSSHEVGSPGSPNVTVTPAEHPLSQYDSGKDSMTCSDASGPNSSENQPANMIELDSPSAMATRMIPGTTDYPPEFDPIVLAMPQSISHDSLFDSKCSHPSAFSVSPTPVPTHNAPHHRSSLEGSCEGSTGSSGVWMSSTMSPSSYHQYNSQTSTSPKGTGDNISPRQSQASKPYDHPNPSIARPRPKPSKDFLFQTISAPSSRPQSPRERSSSSGSHQRSHASSPTGSVHSMRMFSFDDYGDYYSDTGSTTSSLVELSLGVEDACTIIDDIQVGDMMGFFHQH